MHGDCHGIASVFNLIPTVRLQDVRLLHPNDLDYEDKKDQ